MQPSPISQAFVLHFGEMGSSWGISRAVGQIYALLYVAPEPLNAEQITGWYADVRQMEAERLVQLLSLGAKVQKILELKDRLVLVSGSKAAPRRNATSPEG